MSIRPTKGGHRFECARRASPGCSTTGESCGVWFESIDERDALLNSDARKFFITSHHDKYPTLLVRYAAVSVGELRELITDSWRVKAPKRLVAEFDAQGSSKEGSHG